MVVNNENSCLYVSYQTNGHPDAVFADRLFVETQLNYGSIVACENMVKTWPISRHCYCRSHDTDSIWFVPGPQPKAPQTGPKAATHPEGTSTMCFGLPYSKEWCCWGGLNSRPRHYQSKGSNGGTAGLLRVLNQCGCAFANNPRQTQTVRSCSLRVSLLKVLWSNRIEKSDLRWTFGTAGYPDMPWLRLKEYT